MSSPHQFCQIYLSLFEQDDSTPPTPKCGELSEHTESAYTGVEDRSSRSIVSNKSRRIIGNYFQAHC